MIQEFINELVNYGNSEIENYQPKADKNLDQFSRMGEYLKSYGLNWNKVLSLLRIKKDEILDKAKSLGFEAQNLNASLDEAMYIVKKNFKDKYAPGS